MAQACRSTLRVAWWTSTDQEALDAEFMALTDEESLTEEDREVLVARAASARTIFRNPQRIRAARTLLITILLAWPLLGSKLKSLHTTVSPVWPTMTKSSGC